MRLSKQSSREAIIAIADNVDGQKPHKALRLVATNDGSFSISAPHHPARSGLVFKSMPTGVLVADGPSRGDMQQVHRVDSLVKLSYHASGFVQFSSAGQGLVRSGRKGPDEFLLSKGLGIQSQPITDPIETGPSIGGAFYNLVECETTTGNEKVRVMVFGEGDHFERDVHTPATNHIYSVEIFVFPGVKRWRVDPRLRDRRGQCRHERPWCCHAPGLGDTPSYGT